VLKVDSPFQDITLQPYYEGHWYLMKKKIAVYFDDRMKPTNKLLLKAYGTYRTYIYRAFRLLVLLRGRDFLL
jgi:hypothetical protein